MPKPFSYWLYLRQFDLLKGASMKTIHLFFLCFFALPAFAGELPMDIGQEIIHPEASILAPGNGDKEMQDQLKAEYALTERKKTLVKQKLKEQQLELEKNLKEKKSLNYLCDPCSDCADQSSWQRGACCCIAGACIILAVFCLGAHSNGYYRSFGDSDWAWCLGAAPTNYTRCSSMTNNSEFRCYSFTPRCVNYKQA